LDNYLCRDRRQPATASYLVSTLVSLLGREEGKCCYALKNKEGKLLNNQTTVIVDINITTALVRAAEHITIWTHWSGRRSTPVGALVVHTALFDEPQITSEQQLVG
jgi:hypothetical protein